MEPLIESLNQIAGILVQIVFSAAGLWCGMKITKNKMDFTGTLVIAFVCSLVGQLANPWGQIFGLLSMFLMLWKFAAAKIFPDSLFVVLVSWGIGFSGKHLILYLAKHIQ
ncbi:MAG: hypothetical protein J6W81_02745 [Lentisphaeria bacterium]|nr:hypothetical protein [Lentisphaeria bacterium]